jgi:hypothetical protein
MKKIWPVFVLMLVASGIYFFTKKNSATNNPSAPNGIISESGSNTSTAPQNPGGIIATSLAPGVMNVVPANSLAAQTGLPNLANTDAVPALPPLTILDNARVVMHNYQDRFGENPVGNNAEITAALTGNNPKQVNFITAASGLRVNENGELVDGFGTPFFFHQLSGHDMEIRSAGKDRRMWTLDDQTTR